MNPPVSLTRLTVLGKFRTKDSSRFGMGKPCGCNNRAVLFSSGGNRERFCFFDGFCESFDECERPSPIRRETQRHFRVADGGRQALRPATLGPRAANTTFFESH